MEPPAHAADPADPAEACAKQPGKWALVRSLNQALKTYAVLPVRPWLGGGAGGGPRPGPTSPGLLGALGATGLQSPKMHADPGPSGLLWSQTPSVNLAPSPHLPLGGAGRFASGK